MQFADHLTCKLKRTITKMKQNKLRNRQYTLTSEKVNIISGAHLSKIMNDQNFFKIRNAILGEITENLLSGNRKFTSIIYYLKKHVGLLQLFIWDVDKRII